MQQLEQILSQRILAWYDTQLGHSYANVSCKILNKNNVAIIVVDNSIAMPLQLLIRHGKEALAKEAHSYIIDEALEPELKALIEEAMGITVVDMLSNTTIETARTGIIAIFADRPLIAKSAAY